MMGNHLQHRPTMPTFANDAAKVAHVRREVQTATDALMARHPWLRHQDAIGLIIQLSAVLGMVACASLYLLGGLPAWATVLGVAVLASITHEMEHDLIHHLYFKKRPGIQNLLLGLGWLARPSTANPWHRRHLHFHHHRYSGHASDVEERAITNGEPWGLKRLLMTADMRLSVLLRVPTLRSASRAYIKLTEQPSSKRELVRLLTTHDFPVAQAYVEAIRDLAREAGMAVPEIRASDASAAAAAAAAAADLGSLLDLCARFYRQRLQIGRAHV